MLENICLKCIETDPQRRYANARDLARDLDPELFGRPVVVSGVELGEVVNNPALFANNSDGTPGPGNFGSSGKCVL